MNLLGSGFRSPGLCSGAAFGPNGKEGEWGMDVAVSHRLTTLAREEERYRE